MHTKRKQSRKELSYINVKQTQKPKTNCEDKTRFIIKISVSERINSASEDARSHYFNGTEESQNSDDKYLPDLTKPQPYMYETCVSKESVKESCIKKESSDSEEDSSRIRNTLWCCGKCKSKTTHAESVYMQKAFAAWIKTKFLKVILKAYFHSFWKYFYPVICQ